MWIQKSVAAGSFEAAPIHAITIEEDVMDRRFLFPLGLGLLVAAGISTLALGSIDELLKKSVSPDRESSSFPSNPTEINESGDFTVQEGVTGSMICCVTPGNVNNGGGLTIADFAFLTSYLFNNGTAPPCWEHADVNGDCAIGISDLSRLFLEFFCSAQSLVCPGCGAEEIGGVPQTLSDSLIIAPSEEILCGQSNPIYVIAQTSSDVRGLTVYLEISHNLSNLIIDSVISNVSFPGAFGPIIAQGGGSPILSNSVVWRLVHLFLNGLMIRYTLSG